MEAKIIAEKFDWTDKLAETAIGDFESYQKDMSYGASTSIGLALAKLKMIEEGYLVEIPCKPGDTVYVATNVNYTEKVEINEVITARVVGICTSQNENREIIWYIRLFTLYGECLIPFDKFGKTVFTNYQEAKEVLEGMKK